MIHHTKIYLLIIFVILSLSTSGCNLSLLGENNEEFDGNRALDNVEYQLELGPRVQGSEAHQKEIKWIVTILEDLDWEVEIQEGIVSGISVQNIIARRGKGTPWVILGSHYDSRPFADRDQSAVGKQQPVPGANDGASSVAILLELARVIPTKLNKQIWLVFFDAEDLASNQLAVGSQYFVDGLVEIPERVVVLDMVGDKDLSIYMEKNSDQELNQEIWDVASELGYTQFIPTLKYAILDDHIPFINAGIKAMDIIDIDYPYWHTTLDTFDKVSSESLKAVGDTVKKWIETYPVEN